MVGFSNLPPALSPLPLVLKCQPFRSVNQFLLSLLAFSEREFFYSDSYRKKFSPDATSGGGGGGEPENPFTSRPWAFLNFDSFSETGKISTITRSLYLNHLKSTDLFILLGLLTFWKKSLLDFWSDRSLYEMVFGSLSGLAKIRSSWPVLGIQLVKRSAKETALR